MRYRRTQEWGFAFWFPVFATSSLASLVGLVALPTMLSPRDGMGGGFAAMGAMVVVAYGALFALPLIISLIFFPRERSAYRLPSVLLGVALFCAFGLNILMLFRGRPQ